eukprot:jgi/Bigna1/126389/aug1.2_g1097
MCRETKSSFNSAIEALTARTVWKHLNDSTSGTYWGEIPTIFHGTGDSNVNYNIETNETFPKDTSSEVDRDYKTGRKEEEEEEVGGGGRVKIEVDKATHGISGKVAPNKNGTTAKIQCNNFNITRIKLHISGCDGNGVGKDGGNEVQLNPLGFTAGTSARNVATYSFTNSASTRGSSHHPTSISSMAPSGTATDNGKQPQVILSRVPKQSPPPLRENSISVTTNRKNNIPDFPSQKKAQMHIDREQTREQQQQQQRNSVRTVTINSSRKGQHPPAYTPPLRTAAVLIVGELDPGMKEPGHLKTALNGFDVYISTYVEYQKQALQLAGWRRERVMLTPRGKVPCHPTGVLVQWWHLDRMLKHFRKLFQSYDVLMKLRADLVFHAPLRDMEMDKVPRRCFQMNSDHSFYAETSIFFAVVDDFYETAMARYVNHTQDYFSIHWGNLRRTVANIFPTTEIVQEVRYPKGLDLRLVNSTESPYRQIRRDVAIPLQSLVYPQSVVSSDLGKLVANIRALRSPPGMSEGISKKKWGNPIFASEKFFFLHVLRTIPVCRSHLPAIGVSRRRNSGSRKGRTIICTGKSKGS